MKNLLTTSTFDTPLGSMIAISDETTLYRLEFTERRHLEREIARLNALISPGTTPVIYSIQQEINAYFDGLLTTFQTPLHPSGTPFQKQVWNALTKIPYSETRSYLEIAQIIGKPTACRAVAQTIGANPFAILIPCHRVINHNGQLGGYAGGINRKQWLIHHENNFNGANTPPPAHSRS